MVEVTLGSDGIAVISLNDPDHPLNILSVAAIESFSEKLDDLTDMLGPPPLGLIITSGKSDNFIVGIDIKELSSIENEAAYAEGSRNLQAVFGKIAAFPFPTVAAINGTCMGGGTEIALNCTFRVITDHPDTTLALPEVKLGLLPGATGSQLLPRLVGIQAALEMMLTGKKIYPARALKMGLVDEIATPATLMEASRALILKGQSGRRRRKGPGRWLLDGPLRALVFARAKKQVLKTTGGLHPAPLAIVELVKKTAGVRLEKGLTHEALFFGALGASAEHQALTHLFFAGSGNRAQVAGEPAAVHQMGIVGAGLMGSGIAKAALESGITVRQKDISWEALAKASQSVHRHFSGKVRKKIMRQRDATAHLGRYSSTTDYSGFAHGQVNLEAAFEEIDIKRQLVAELEKVMPDSAVIASNTSSLSIEAIAAGARHPERIVGMHFFSPVEKMPLLEVIASPATNADTLATAVALGRRMGKTVLLVKDSPGFYVNRVLTPYLSETFKLLQEGAAIEQVDAAARALGFPIGPCALLDEVGLDIIGKVMESMTPFLGERLELENVVTRLIDDGRLGRKNGRGFYNYSGGKRGAADEAIYTLLGAAQRKKIPQEGALQRLHYALLNEAAHALEEGVIDDPTSGDMGAVYGCGYPPHLGGPFWTMDRLGIGEVVETLGRLAQRHGPRFTPAHALTALGQSGETYFPKKR